VSRLDDNAGDEANKKAETVKEQIVAGQWAASQKSWGSLLDFIDTKSGNVVRLVYLSSFLYSNFTLRTI